MGKVISFCSGKGGVGKTTLVANLGQMFAKSGKKTLLIDADWNLGKLGIAMGVRPMGTWNRILKNPNEFKESIQKASKNLSLLASPSGVLGLEQLSSEIRAQLFFEIENVAKQYDVVLLDHSSGIHSDVLEFAAPAQEHVIVTTVEPTSYTDAYAIMKLLAKKFSVKDFSLVTTQCHNLNEDKKVIQRFLDVAQQHLNIVVKSLGLIPWDSRFSKCIQKRRPFVEQFSQDTLTEYFSALAKRLAQPATAVNTGLNYNYQPENHF